MYTIWIKPPSPMHFRWTRINKWFGNLFTDSGDYIGLLGPDDITMCFGNFSRAYPVR